MNAADTRYMRPCGSSNDDAFATFVTTQNIGRYRTLLATETHPGKREMLLELLANELAKLPELMRRAELIKTTRFL